MKRRALVMVAALALAGGACGGDDDGEVTDDAAATSDGAEDAADDSGDDGDEGASSDSDWCELSRRLEAEADPLEGVDVSDPDALEEGYQQMIDIVEDAAGDAPDEIRDDVDLVVERSKEVFEALKDADFNVLDIDQALLEDPEADAATERIEAYNESECGIDAGGTADTVDDGATDDSTADAGDDADDILTGEGTVRDELLRQFTAMGMTEDQANCLVDNLDMEEVAASGADNPSMFLDLFETCDIELTDLQTGG